MTSTTIQLPDDVDSCHDLIRAKDAAVTDLLANNADLKRQLEYLLRQKYGRKSEQLDPSDTLFAKWLEQQGSVPVLEAPKQSIASHQRVKPTGRKPLPDDLPRKEVIHDIPESQLPCPCCGDQRRRMGEEVAEQLEYIPASIHVIRHVRYKYACRACEGQIVVADKPIEGLDKSLMGPGLLSQILTSKYCDHQPLYRLEGIFKRHGVDLARSTMCQSVGRSADLLKPLVERMKTRVLASKVIQTDDTTVKQQVKGKGKTKQCRFWSYVGAPPNPYIVYDYTLGRGREGPVAWFKNSGFKGYLQADAYSGYDGFFTSPTWRMTEVGCWAHARRKFYDCRTASPEAHQIVLWVRDLYDVEDKELDAESLQAMRREQSKPILDKIFEWCRSNRQNALPKSGLGKAIGYALNHREALERYIEDGDLSIDNNACERSMRGIAIGRKNWLFTGSERGGKSAAIIFSLISSCKRHDLDPFVYLRDVITRLPATRMSQIDQFLPDVWKTDHTE